MLYPLCAFYLRAYYVMGSFVKRERETTAAAATPPLRPLSLLAKEEDKWAYQITWCCEWVCAKNVLLKKGARLFIRGNRNYNAKRIPPHADTERAEPYREDYFHRRRGHGENACLNRWRWVQEWKVLCRGWFLRSSRRGRRICMQSASSAVISAKCLFSPHHTSFKIVLLISEEN
jgi:hypothetical protein